VLARASSVVGALEDVGLSGLAARLRGLESSARAGAAAAPMAWIDAALRLELTREAAGD
jgi:hypothetical protein